MKTSLTEGHQSKAVHLLIPASSVSEVAKAVRYLSITLGELARRVPSQAQTGQQPRGAAKSPSTLTTSDARSI